MRVASISWLVVASCLLITVPTSGATRHFEQAVWVEPEARLLAASPSVERATEALLEQTLEGADAGRLIAAMERIRTDRTLSAVQRDAILHGYVERLREYSPGLAPMAVLDWLSRARPLAVTGHEEGSHHGVAVFNVASAARGLANQWAWQRGHDEIERSKIPFPPTLGEELGRTPAGTPRIRGMRYAISRLPIEKLDALAAHCAVMLGGCGEVRADIELARGNLRWLKPWLKNAAPAAVTPRLRRLHHFLPAHEAEELLKTALSHPDKGVAAWAMSDLTARMPKDGSLRRKWGSHLVSLLDDPDLGAAAALQLARMDSVDWLEAASVQTLGADARRRLELLAELESAVQASKPESEAKP